MTYPDIVDQIADEQYRFVLFCDDLSFDQVMAARALKLSSWVHRGGNAERAALRDLRIAPYLLPEYFPRERRDEVRWGRSCTSAKASRKVSLSERFGSGFRSIRSQEDYLAAPRSHSRTGALRCRWMAKMRRSAATPQLGAAAWL